MNRVPDWLGNQESRLWSVMARLAAITGLVFPIASIVAFVITGSLSTPAAVLSVYICVLCTTLIILMIRQENRYIAQVKKYQDDYLNEAKKHQEQIEAAQREMRYGPAMLPLRRAYSDVAEASWNHLRGDTSPEAFRLHLQESLRYFSEAFTLITGVTCRSSIKLVAAPNGPTGDLTVSTLCRDHNSPEPSNRPDRISDNTDFKHIFLHNEPKFFCNDLVAAISKGYRNSHWDEKTIEAGEFDYRSTIVWPIGRAGDVSTGHKSDLEIIGFLCVDSLETEVFHQTYDVAIGGAFAQALQLALTQFRTKQ
ncbi:hypothetical protein SAMN04489727_1793 [Amycolatopsis tolypomycina]|uniref:GAF domain-containing protein n=1 Tax=Amycolatopsis tolypomycina TaxID=208445 RepID=A0A1H4JED0_9PSEU|nr:hypothetical protein [Amycolatopsis tolypomycina]SEB44336.1 hypothetical protein SAMN04489727_1793 [Amycolatopsis tolypomycina]